MISVGCVVSAVTWLWLSMDTAIAPPTDSAHHLLNAILFARALSEGGPAALWRTMRAFYVGWPPANQVLFYGPMGALFGDSPATLRAISVVLVAPLLWGGYRLGLELTGDRRAATLAAVLTVTSIGIMGQLRQVSIDLPATVAVLLALWSMVRTLRRPSPRALLLVGAATGLCLFSRVQAAFFVTGPLLVLAVWLLRSADSGGARLRRVGWLTLSAATALLVSSPWWWGRLGQLWVISTAHLDPHRITPRGDPHVLAGLIYYGRALGGVAGWGTLAVALALIPALFRRPGPSRWSGALMLSSVLGGVLGCTMGVHREPRYLLPAVPPLVMLAVAGLWRARTRLRGPVGAGLLLAGVLPTLWLAAFPLDGRNPLCRHGLLEWAYVRRPLRVDTPAMGAQVYRAVLAAGMGQHQGRDVYVLLAQDARYNYLPRLAAHLLAHMPRALFGSTINLRIPNLPMHLRARQTRHMVVLAGRDDAMDLPVLWRLAPRPWRNRSPVVLYKVPRPHPLRALLRPIPLRRRPPKAARTYPKGAGVAAASRPGHRL